jgi:hypothetical protein
MHFHPSDDCSYIFISTLNKLLINRAQITEDSNSSMLDFLAVWQVNAVHVGKPAHWPTAKNHLYYYLPKR